MKMRLPAIFLCLFVVTARAFFETEPHFSLLPAIMRNCLQRQLPYCNAIRCIQHYLRYALAQYCRSDFPLSAYTSNQSPAEFGSLPGSQFSPYMISGAQGVSSNPWMDASFDGNFGNRKHLGGRFADPWWINDKYVCVPRNRCPDTSSCGLSANAGFSQQIQNLLN